MIDNQASQDDYLAAINLALIWAKSLEIILGHTILCSCTNNELSLIPRQLQNSWTGRRRIDLEIFGKNANRVQHGQEIS